MGVRLKMLGAAKRSVVPKVLRTPYVREEAIEEFAVDERPCDLDCFCFDSPLTVKHSSTAKSLLVLVSRLSIVKGNSRSRGFSAAFAKYDREHS